MGISSYTYLEASWPDGTETRTDPGCVFDRVRRLDGYGYLVGTREGEAGYADSVLDDVVEMFGRPLDEVPDLELLCTYETNDVDEGFFYCSLHIWDGRCVYEQSRIDFEKRPMDECPFDIGRG